MNIGFQGEYGAFGHEAALKYFGKGHALKGFLEFSEVVSALSGGVIDYGVLPIENTTTGTIVSVLDVVSASSVSVIGDVELPLVHHVLGLEGATLEGLTEIYSHSQGFDQSKGFLKPFKGIKKIPFFNTAYSAKYVAQCKDLQKAAIASQMAAEVYGLRYLASDIHDRPDNQTRFWVIGPKREKKPFNKVSIRFSLPNERGALYQVLKRFNNACINMSKIESRPFVNKPFEYDFFIDFQWSSDFDTLMEVLEGLKALKILGLYSEAIFSEKE